MLPTMEKTHAVLAFVVVVASASYALLRRYLETKKPFRDLPMAPGSHFVFGHIHIMLGDDFKDTFQRLFINANEYGQVSFWFFRYPVVGVSSVKDARTVLAAEHERHPPRLVKHFSRQFIGEKNLLFINGKEWKFHRGAVARTFNPKFLLASRPGMQDVAATMVTSLQERSRQSPNNIQEFEIEKLMKMITLEVFGRIALSTDLGLCKTLQPSPLVKSFEYLLSGTMTRLRSPLSPKNFFFSLPYEQNRIHKRERTLIRSFVADLINDKRNSLGEDDKNDKDLLSHLIRAHREVPEGKLNEEDVSDDAMTDVLMTLLFAGYDTTSVTLTFALYVLAQNQQVQQRCVEEINSVKSTTNFEELVYTKAVIWEVLRLFPAGTRTNRNLAKPLELSGGFVAPVGTRVFIPIYSIMRDEKNFSQPEEFRPDRWAKQDSAKKCWVEREEGDELGTIEAGNRKAFLAFSAGGRNCVGQRFAIQEAVIVLATLLKGLKVSPVADFVLETTDKDLILKPANGMPLKVEARA
jgi:cytochrome P450